VSLIPGVRIQERRGEWKGNEKEKQRTRAEGRTRDEESFQFIDVSLIQANPSTRTLLCLYRLTSWAGYTTHATRLSLGPLSSRDAAVGLTGSEPTTRKPSSWQLISGDVISMVANKVLDSFVIVTKTTSMIPSPMSL
jgi:hypothetical protein